MVNFRETAKDIFDICRYPHKAEGRATEKIEKILAETYNKGRTDGLNTALSVFAPIPNKYGTR